MWVRQCDLDAQVEAPPPIPARIVSNEEFFPPPPSPQQEEYEDRLTGKRLRRLRVPFSGYERANGHA